MTCPEMLETGGNASKATAEVACGCELRFDWLSSAVGSGKGAGPVGRATDAIRYQYLRVLSVWCAGSRPRAMLPVAVVGNVDPQMPPERFSCQCARELDEKSSLPLQMELEGQKTGGVSREFDSLARTRKFLYINDL